MGSPDVSPTPAPSRTTPSAFPIPTFSSSLTSPPSLVTNPPVLRARDDTASSTRSRCPNEVVVVISTQVLIPDYHEYYAHVPIQQFRMNYQALPDGSLVTDPYLKEIQQGNWFLLLIGMFLMLFLRNTLVSADYTRRGRVKRKGLFYILLISQAAGVLTFTIMATSYFLVHVNCRVTMIIEGILTDISAALMLSGILGLKAYRCLNNSKFVLGFIVILQAASSAFVLTDLARLQAIRRISRTCTATTPFIYLPLAVALRLIIALFICLCFIYAIWKASKFPAAQGRISLRLSERATPEPPLTEKEEVSSIAPRPRGWWDYVPNKDDQAPAVQPERLRPSWHITEDGGFVQNMRLLFLPKTRDKYTHRHHRRVASEPGPSRQRSTVHFQDNEKSYFEFSRSSSPTQSHTGSMRKLMNRMRLFREMLRNELAHTALIALTNVIATVLILVGVFCLVPVTPAIFIGAYWAVLSLSVMNSFARVIQRHEREALLQHPSAWDPLYHVEKATNGDVRRALSTASVASNPYRARSIVEILDDQDYMNDEQPPQQMERGFQKPQQSAENPFEDFESVSQLVPASLPFAQPSSSEIDSFEGRKPMSAASWNPRDYDARPPSVPSSFSAHDHNSVISWESQPRVPADHFEDLFYKPKDSPQSKYPKVY